MQDGRDDLVVENVADWDAFLALEPEWRTLEATSKLPFESFDWAVAWWNHFREDQVGVRDALFAHTLRRRDGSLVAVAPMVLTSRPSRSPFCVRQVHFFGADPNITELRGLIARPEDRARAYRALVEHLRTRAEEWDWVLLSGLPADATPEGLGLDDTANFEWVRDVADYVLELPDSWETLRGSLPRNIKESLRKCYNSLNRDGLTFDLQVLRDEADVQGGLAHFFELHSARAAADVAVKHRNLFETDIERQFLVDACVRFARRGALRLFLLRVQGVVVAARIGFEIGDTLYLYYSGYDPRYARYSIMTTAMAESVKFAISEGFRSVNLSTGCDVAKTRWRPTEVVYREGRLVSSSRRSALAHGVFSRAKSEFAKHPVLARATRLLARRSSANPAAGLER